MEPENVIGKWVGRNWPLAMTCAVLIVGAGVLLMRSAEYESPSTAEAASVEPVSSVMMPGDAVVIPGNATVIVPGGDSAAKPVLVSDTALRK